MSNLPRSVITDFKCIENSFWVREPVASSISDTTAVEPRLILLMTWTGALGKHISTYTTRYVTSFPRSTIVVVTTSSADFMYRSSKRKRMHLQPVVQYIIKLFSPKTLSESRGILLHAFSEGGSHKSCELASEYLKATTQKLPVMALVLDSTPGCPRFTRLCSALATSFPPIFIIKQLALAIAIVVLAITWTLYHVIKGYENNPVSRARRQLLDSRLFDISIPRCYMYSKLDRLIAWEDINEHVRSARGQGSVVLDYVFETSGHVDHAKVDPDRYWSGVKSVWQRSQETARASRLYYLPTFDFERQVV
jgi:hypothetical protein